MVASISANHGSHFFKNLKRGDNYPTKNSNPSCTAIIYTLSRSVYPLQPHTAHFLLVATSDFPLQSNLPNRYIYPVHHVTDILHPPAYEDGTDKEFETSAIKTQTPGNYPKRNILLLKHGESLKTGELMHITQKQIFLTKYKIR